MLSHSLSHWYCKCDLGVIALPSPGGGRAGGDAHAAAAGDGADLRVRGGPARALPDAAAGGRTGVRRHAPVGAGDQGWAAAGGRFSMVQGPSGHCKPLCMDIASHGHFEAPCASTGSLWRADPQLLVKPPSCSQGAVSYHCCFEWIADTG